MADWRSFFGRMFDSTGVMGLFGAANSRNLQVEAQVRDLLREARRKDLWDQKLDSLRYVVLDTETTGFNPTEDMILSIGAVEMNGTVICEGKTYHSYISLPARKEIPETITELTGISMETIADAPSLKKVLQEFLTFAGDAVLVAHHALHEMRFLQAAFRRTFRADFSHRFIDTARVAQIIEGRERIMTLDELASVYGIPLHGRHTAIGDAWITGRVWSCLLQESKKMGIRSLGELLECVSRGVSK
jgi:DNA polymerase-3 subunit epsilon